MPAARKPKPKTDLKVVGPDMEALERTIVDFAAHQQPMLTAVDTARETQQAALRKIETARDDLRADRKLITSAYETLMQAFDAREDDLNKAADIHENGLNSLSQQVQKAAAE